MCPEIYGHLTRMGFAYLVIDANAQSTTEDLEQKILYQFGLLNYISSD